MKGVIDRRSLCDRCKSSVVTENAGQQRAVFCAVMNRRVDPDIRACNRYTPIGATGAFARGEVSLADAHIIDPRPMPGQVI